MTINGHPTDRDEISDRLSSLERGVSCFSTPVDHKGHAGPLFFCFQRERGTRRKGNIELWDWIESMVDELGGQKGLRWHESIQNESQENGG